MRNNHSSTVTSKKHPHSKPGHPKITSQNIKTKCQNVIRFASIRENSIVCLVAKGAASDAAHGGVDEAYVCKVVAAFCVRGTCKTRAGEESGETEEGESGEDERGGRWIF